MKKKVVYGIFLAITIIGIMIVMFSNNIEIVKKIKENILKTEQINNSEKNITTVNITDLESNITIEHEHIYKTVYNEINHWEECKICGAKNNEQNHSYKNNWSMGSANYCNIENINKFVCACGYSYESTLGRKNHSMNYGLNNPGSFQKFDQCPNCLYTRAIHDCYKSDGTKINCLNLGTCSICKYTYIVNATNHCNSYIMNESEDKNVYCKRCDTYLAKINRCELIKESDNIYKFYTSVTAPNGASYVNVVIDNYFGTNVTTSNNVSKNGTTWSCVTTITFNGHSEINKHISIGYNYTLNGRKSIIYIDTNNFCIDTEKPEISNIEQKRENELAEWSKNKTITISGTENYCNTVILEIINDNGMSIYKGSGNVINNKYSISCIPDIEANTEGKIFTAIVTDVCDNSTSQKFTISKVDSISPTPASENEVGGEWAKSKNFTFKATDEGIGNVQIAFNDIGDLQPATLNENNEYEREYEFTGDVYSPKELSVLYKDELGNTTIQKVTIDKLDNTAPTITDTNIHNNKLTVEANDIKEGMGEGSGITKYRYITSEEKLENPKVSETATEVNVGEDFIISNIDKVKYIYIVAEDLVRKCK